MPFSIRTEGKFSHRDDVIERAGDFWGNGKTKGVIRSCEEAPRSVKAREKAIERLALEVDPELLDEIVGLLETTHVQFSYSVEGEGEGAVSVDVKTSLGLE